MRCAHLFDPLSGWCLRCGRARDDHDGTTVFDGRTIAAIDITEPRHQNDRDD